jgi:hypothetical protein
MSEPLHSPRPSPAEAEFLRQERETTRPFDPELLRLVMFINALDGTEIGITLHVHGTIVSGLLISNARFYRLLVKSFADRSTESGDSFESFAKFYQFTLNDVEKELDSVRDKERQLEPPRHIHLRHAQTYVTSGAAPFTAPLWRGRLSAIDGWSIGNYDTIEPLDEGYRSPA